MSASLVRHRPDLSSTVGGASASRDLPFVHHAFYFGLPGREADLELLLRNHAELLKAQGIQASVDVFEAVLGEGMPLYVRVEPATSAAAYYAERERRAVRLEGALEDLERGLLSVTRAQRAIHGLRRPDLSFVPGPVADHAAAGTAP